MYIRGDYLGGYKKNINVNIWRGNKPIKQEIIDGNIAVPESIGSVIYEVIANWKQGTISYVFLVNVN